MPKLKYQQVINEKLTEQEIQTAIKIVKNFQNKRNTILEHEFAEYLILFQEDAINLQREESEYIIDKFSERFDLFHGITVVNLMGEVVLELPPVLRSPETLNGIAESLIQQYTNAVKMSDPLRKYDIAVANDIVDAIQKTTDMNSVKAYIENKVRLEKKYLLKTEDVASEENVNIDGRIKISTEGMF